MSSLPAIERFESSIGARLYRIPVEAFPGNFIAYCYLVLNLDVPTLIDTGSGLGHSNEDLLDGLAALRDQFDEKIAVRDIRRVLITHGHIDHFGGLAFIHEQIGAAGGSAQVGIHPLDRRVLTAYEERVIVATKDLRVYLERAGVKPELRSRLIEMYGFAKKHVRSVGVDISLDESATLEGMTFLHTPGHCSGQVCIVIGDVMLSADHVLARTSPHQAPESITHYTGLGHYLDALTKVQKTPGIRLALGGHEAPIHDFYTRIDDIRTSHQRKLNRVLDTLRNAGRPCTISDISRQMYPDKHGYEILLALEEVGAHVEYLYQHGMLSVCNLEEMEREDNPALQYGLA